VLPAPGMGALPLGATAALPAPATTTLLPAVTAALPPAAKPGLPQSGADGARPRSGDVAQTPWSAPRFLARGGGGDREGGKACGMADSQRPARGSFC
jgi:hypothetical protein